MSGITLGSKHQGAAPWAESSRLGEDKTFTAWVQHLRSKNFQKRTKSRQETQLLFVHYLLIGAVYESCWKNMSMEKEKFHFVKNGPFIAPESKKVTC